MMKKSRLTRLFSLFAALMMCVSLLSAVASASDSGIQPHTDLCDCGDGVMHTVITKKGESYVGRPRCSQNHSYNCPVYKIQYLVEETCTACGIVGSHYYDYTMVTKHDHTGTPDN